MMNRISTVLPVTDVTLFEDRARVRRIGTLDLPTGPSIVEIDGISPVVSNKSLTAALSAQDEKGTTQNLKTPADPRGFGDAAVVGSSVKRNLKTAEEADSADVDSQIKELTLRREELADEIRNIEKKRDDLRRIIDLAAQEIPDDIAAGRKGPEESNCSSEELDGRLVESAAEQYETEWELENLDNKINELEVARGATLTPSNRCEALAVLDITVTTPGSYKLEVEYTVPAACWRPGHRAVLNGKTLQFETDGWVWQRTGEDWNGVNLSLSTHRPSLGSAPPILSDDIITVIKREKEDIVEIREESVDDTGLGSNMAQGKTPKSLPGVDDGGVVRNFTAGKPVDIPSDGRPRNFALVSFEGTSETDLIAMPELSPYGFIRSRQSNVGSHPVLAGPVELIRNGTRVGRTHVSYVESGELFPLGWGPDPDIRIHRTEETRHKEAGKLGSKDKTDYLVKIKISNIGSNSKTLTVKERIPVSEIGKVKIIFDEKASSEGYDGPDADGFITWSVELSPLEKTVRELVYTIEKHKNVVGL